MDIGMSLLAYKQQSSAAKLASTEGKLAAEMEGVAALQRETDRKLELVKAISSQRASASGRGIEVNTGSPLAVINNTIEDADKDIDRDRFNSKIAAQSALYRGAARSGQLKGQAQLSLLKGVVDSIQGASSGGKVK